MKINPIYSVPYMHFEGIDASGKTTQLERAEEYFRKAGHDAIMTRQPGGTRIGQLIRGILLNPDHMQLAPETEVLLYMGDRIQHIKEVVIPSLNNGKFVFQDRGEFATKAYQGYGRGLDMEFIDDLHDNVVVRKNSPDSVLFFDISVDTSIERLGVRNEEARKAGYDVKNDRLEAENKAFFERVRNGYHECKKQNPDLITIINAERSIEEIHKDVIEHIKELIEEKPKILK